MEKTLNNQNENINCMVCEDSLGRSTHIGLSKAMKQPVILSCPTCTQIHVLDQEKLTLIENSYR